MRVFDHVWTCLIERCPSAVTTRRLVTISGLPSSCPSNFTWPKSNETQLLQLKHAQMRPPKIGLSQWFLKSFDTFCQDSWCLWQPPAPTAHHHPNGFFWPFQCPRDTIFASTPFFWLTISSDNQILCATAFVFCRQPNGRTLRVNSVHQPTIHCVTAWFNSITPRPVWAELEKNKFLCWETAIQTPNNSLCSLAPPAKTLQKPIWTGVPHLAFQRCCCSMGALTLKMKLSVWSASHSKYHIILHFHNFFGALAVSSDLVRNFLRFKICQFISANMSQSVDCPTCTYSECCQQRLSLQRGYIMPLTSFTCLGPTPTFSTFISTSVFAALRIWDLQPEWVLIISNI